MQSIVYYIAMLYLCSCKAMLCWLTCASERKQHCCRAQR
nr:MAG TPA: hypothetical protein [Caudoviricetes sp.]